VRDALRARGAMPVDPGDAVDVLRVIEAARRSATSGRTVRVTGLRDRAPGPRPGSER
jgi:predicted dehydrogenase